MEWPLFVSFALILTLEKLPRCFSIAAIDIDIDKDDDDDDVW